MSMVVGTAEGFVEINDDGTVEAGGIEVLGRHVAGFSLDPLELFTDLTDRQPRLDSGLLHNIALM